MRVTQLLLAFIVIASNVHASHARRSSAPVPGSSPLHAATVPHAQTPGLPVPMHESEDMQPVEPFEVSDATVHGPVSGHLQEQLVRQIAGEDTAYGSQRSLLHGTKKLFKYSKCRKCRMVQCNGGKSFCSGHCRKKRKLFFCSSTRRAASDCQFSKLPVIEDFVGKSPDDLRTYDTAVVTVPAPYIGCADIGNRPSGCPAPGTRAKLAGRISSVRHARCRSEYYIPKCLGPLLPFGICECVYRVPLRRRIGRRYVRDWTFTAPCKTSDLEAGSGVGGSDGSPSEEGLFVVWGAEDTQTWFSNFTEEGQEPDLTHTVTASSRSVDVVATLSFFPEDVRTVPDENIVDDAELVEEGYEISGDYDYDG